MHNKIQRKGKIFQEKIQKIDRMIYLTDLHRYTLLYNNNRNFMSNFEVDKDKYIRKLLKMMNEREKEIQNLKRQLRANKERTAGVDKECEGKRTIDETIKQELYLTSSQLKEVTMQMNTMQSKMVELQLGLEQQINKNNELQAQITSLQTQNQRLKNQKEQLLNQNTQLKEDNSRHRETVLKTQIEFQEISSQVRTLFEKLDALRGSQEILRAEKNDLVAEIDQIRQRQLRNNLQRIQLEKQVSYLKVELVQKHNEIQMKDKELAFKQKEIEQKDQQIAENGKEIQSINSTLNEIKNSYRKLEKDLQEKINQLQLKSREAHHLSESLKDYEEFSFEISKYIESTYLKHCCQGHLRSSKKIIKEVQKNQTMFESSFKKMTEIQNWMDDKAEKLQKLIQQNALPEQTLDGISMINRSLVQKVQICDLTQQLEKEKEQLEIIENQVLNNLQKDIEKSYERERSHIVQLGQVREVLKMTKDVNRQLFEQVNKQNCVINECKKIYEKCLPRNSQEFHLMKRILDQI